MKFSVSKEVFDKMDNVFFGIVVANGNKKMDMETK